MKSHPPSPEASPSIEDTRLKISRLRAELKKTEPLLWDTDGGTGILDDYQKKTRRMEAEIALLPEDNRHTFYLTIPVADRPIHLQQCLHSILKLCELYHYGGYDSQGAARQRFKKVYVIVADDSMHEKNINQHRKICRSFLEKGLHVEYFGLEQQIQSIENIDIKNLCKKEYESLNRVIGNYARPLKPALFSHKGASITRNICYLRLNEIHRKNPEQKKLFYFLDSDQEFCVKSPVEVTVPDTHNRYYAISYFHHLDEIFSDSNIEIVTGKVVGDPPVSPSVMAANFQDDILFFLENMADLDPDASCCFHHADLSRNTDAAYHDMSSLFGFQGSQQAFHYPCPRTDPHNNRDCFLDFSARLKNFFHGEHATRETRFIYSGDLTAVTAARTVYTGNYIFRPENIDFFISFATLKLRMAGPTLGRLLQSTLKNKFVSANLPMLHTRTVETLGKSEYRSGVISATENSEAVTDLSQEFEKQFFGDIMLFTIIELQKNGYPETTGDDEKFKASVRAILTDTEARIRQLYLEKHKQVRDKADKLKTRISNESEWWQEKSEKSITATSNFFQFINNINYNFRDSSKGHQLINSPENTQQRLTEIAEAIFLLQSDRAHWKAILRNTTQGHKNSALI